jgi:hypothetical protein
MCGVSITITMECQPEQNHETVPPMRELPARASPLAATRMASTSRSISIVTSFAPIEEHSPIRRLGVTNVLSATCYRCPVTRHLLLRVPRQTKGCLVKGADALQHVGNTANHHLGPVASGCLLEVGGHRAAPVRMIKEVRQSLL